ncbi:hypothetical protein R6Q59_008970 [Mikania micrantha]
MSIIPNFFGGRRTNVFDPFSLDVWDPFEGFPFNSNFRSLSDQVRSSETSSFVNAKIDWKETADAHVFNGRRAWAEKGRGEGGGGGRSSAADQWREEQRERGQRRHVAPCGAKQREVCAKV